MRATPLAEARQLLEVVEVVHVLLLAVLVGGGGGVEARGGSPSLEHVGGAQGGKRNQTVGVLVIFEAAPEQALDGLKRQGCRAPPVPRWTTSRAQRQSRWLAPAAPL